MMENSIVWIIGWFLVGLLALFGGGHLLVQGTVATTYRLKSQVFFVALLLLGIGTSAPELFVTLQSHYRGESDMAVGNIVGSNIFKVLIVGALAFMSFSLIMNRKMVLKNTALLLGATLVACLLLLDGILSRWNGVLLLALFSLFFMKPFRANPDFSPDSKSAVSYSWWVISGFLAMGFLFLFVGAKWTIQSSILIGEHFQLPKRILGILLLSVGTSLPELAVGVMAIVKRNSEMAIGGIVGSNVFNTFLIPGVASLWFPLSISGTILKTDGSVMFLSEILLLLFLLLSRIIPKYVAGLWIFSYVLYCYFLMAPT